MDSEVKVLITTADSEELVETLCRQLLEKNLAACIQAFPVKSRYRWEGGLQCDSEILLLVKTSSRSEQAAIEEIRTHHTYDLPEIISLPVTSGLPDYLEWVNKESSGTG